MQSSDRQSYQSPQPIITGSDIPHEARARKKLKPPFVISLAGLVVVAALGVGAFFWLQNTGEDKREIPAAQVAITKEGFNPATIKIKKENEITWTNNSSQPHQITADNQKLELESGESLAEGDSYSYTFTEKGTYTYHDPLDPLGFKGTIIVE